MHDLRRATWSAVLATLIYVAACLTLAGPASAMTCPNGADVKDERYCRLFRHYAIELAKLDPRVASRVGAKSPDQTRSLALIVGNSLYPKLGAVGVLKPAAADVAKLVAFLTDEQHFDEVIALENDDATKENIDYFLQDYLPQRGVDYEAEPSKGRARLVFAYSGHGLNKSLTSPAALLLTSASNANDTSAMYMMEDLRARLQNLAPHYFHVLALINACFGGNLFGGGSTGGNPSVSEQPGAYALTAGPDDKTVASLGGLGDGSVFFDAIIRGVRNGEADSDYARLVAADGTLLQQGGITRLGALATYLDTEISILNLKRIMTEDGVLKLDKPWIGPVEPGTDIARGGFFFLSPIKLSGGQTTPLDVPPGPLSSLPGRPDIRVFSAQEEYPVRGIDVSQAEAHIDWDVVKAKGDFRFAYARAISWAGQDKNFRSHWSEIKRVGLDRGAYVIFDYCLTPAQQADALAAAVPPDPDALPTAIEIVVPDFNQKQNACFQAAGLGTDQTRLIEFADLLRKVTGKVPLIYGNRNNIHSLLDDRFDRFMLWLAIYRKSGKLTADDLKLAGHNPWTFWQYTSGLTVPGIGDNVDGNVFFGTEAQYLSFKAGQENAALSASVNAAK